MPVGAPPGSQNRANGKRFQLALRRALEEYEDDRVKRGEALNTLAMDLVREALLGQQWAVLEIINRLDGKPAQRVIGDDDEAPVQLAGMIRLVRPMLEVQGHE